MLRELKIATVFLTRWPMRLDERLAMRDLASTVHCFPLVGALVGAVGGLVFITASLLHLPGLPAAILAIAAVAILTGALHEDGLADTADAFGALPDRQRALEIMHDSRIGTFGTIALVLVLAGRLAALASFWDVLHAAAALISAAAFSRAVLPAIMYLQPTAKRSGLAAEAGRPQFWPVLASLVIGILVTVLLLPMQEAVTALLAAGGTAAVLAWLFSRAFGGCTGDTLGAVQQVGELAFLFALVAWR